MLFKIQNLILSVDLFVVSVLESSRTISTLRFCVPKLRTLDWLKLSFVLATLLVISVSAPANAKEKGIISVTGEAKMDVVPDVVDVSLVVEISDKNLNIAQRKNDEIVANVLKIAKALDIADKNVQTNYINVRPVYEQISGKMVFTRFETVKGIEVKLTDISKLQELLEKTAEAGVNRVDGVNFTSSKFERLQNDVQVMAAKNAKMRADTIAASLGAKVDKPFKITVNSSYQSPAQRGGVMMMKAASISDQTIAAGQVTITANVNVDFELD
jgi:uncharacterized protein YggE